MKCRKRVELKIQEMQLLKLTAQKHLPTISFLVGEISGVRSLPQIDWNLFGRGDRHLEYHIPGELWALLTQGKHLLDPRVCFQAFSVGSSVWLSVWSSDETNYTTNSTEYAAKRDMYLGVYGALGIGQGNLFWLSALTKTAERYWKKPPHSISPLNSFPTRLSFRESYAA